jgi:hypothetical protein
MKPARSAFGAPPQGGAASGPAKPDPRRLLEGALRCAGAVAGAVFIAGCGGPPATASLFPLEPGHRWQYDVRTEWENHNAVEHEERVITSEGEATLDGASAWRRRSADGVEWYLRADSTGVYRVASKVDIEDEPQRDAGPRFVLKAPLRAGTAWQHPTTAYLLRRRSEFPPEIRHTHPSVPMNYAIEALDDTVEVRAGRFERCLRVRGQAVLKLFADPVAGWREMPLTTTEWYCHGPGLVKLVREEPANSPFLTGGRLTMELIEWK